MRTANWQILFLFNFIHPSFLELRLYLKIKKLQLHSGSKMPKNSCTFVIHRLYGFIKSKYKKNKLMLARETLFSTSSIINKTKIVWQEIMLAPKNRVLSVCLSQFCSCFNQHNVMLSQMLIRKSCCSTVQDIFQTSSLPPH